VLKIRDKAGLYNLHYTKLVLGYINYVATWVVTLFMATVIVTGGTGLIGTALTAALLQQGYKVIVLTRRAKPSAGGIAYREWNVEEGTIDELAIGEADFIIHLAGANVAGKRWTDERKKEIANSRIKSGKLLVSSLKKIPNKVKAIVSSSAIGWYGADRQIQNSKPFVETDPADDSFLGQTCVEWERSMQPVEDGGKRLVFLRTGIVLSNQGGAYAEFKKPLAFGVAGVLGDGKQIISWIHIDDLVQIYIAALEDETMHGVYNAVAPHPVSNKELILTIAKRRGKFYVPVLVPSAALKIALGEMSVEILKSTTVSAQKIVDKGFKFDYPTISDAIKNLESMPV
jgi:uncharacterized protein (TIGR01777 family)